MRETAYFLAVGAVSMMHTIDPDLVLFGGGMIQAGESFLEAIRQDVRRMAFPIPAAKTRIEFAKLGGEAGFVGAAGLGPDGAQSAFLTAAAFFFRAAFLFFAAAFAFVGPRPGTLAGSISVEFLSSWSNRGFGPVNSSRLTFRHDPYPSPRTAPTAFFLAYR